jgi:hypothetical protein
MELTMVEIAVMTAGLIALAAERTSDELDSVFLSLADKLRKELEKNNS